MRDIESLIRDGGNAMREKLMENKDKGEWDDLTIKKLLDLSDLETMEIKFAVYIFQHKLKDPIEALHDIRREAADRMNFDAMLIQRCNKVIKEMLSDKQ